MRHLIKDYFTILKKSAQQFVEDNAVKLSASLSYYTVFSIAPLLIIVMSLTGFFFGAEAVQGKIYYQLNDLVGSKTALQIQEIIQNIRTSNHSTTGTIIGTIALIVGATGVFTEIQDSINYIWSVKAKPKKGWLKLIMNRLLSFSLIVSFGFILLVSLVISALMDLLSDKLMVLFPDMTVYVFYVINHIIIFFVISFLFAIIFKILPDAEIKWKDAFIGAFFTAILFIVGKFLIGYYLGASKIGVTYGAAASIIIILLWVYYSSIILFFGAEFTHMYAKYFGGGIEPNDTAVFIVKKEVREVNNGEIPD